MLSETRTKTKNLYLSAYFPGLFPFPWMILILRWLKKHHSPGSYAITFKPQYNLNLCISFQNPILIFLLKRCQSAVMLDLASILKSEFRWSSSAPKYCLSDSNTVCLIQKFKTVFLKITYYWRDGKKIMIFLFFKSRFYKAQYLRGYTQEHIMNHLLRNFIEAVTFPNNKVRNEEPKGLFQRLKCQIQQNIDW